MSIGISICRKQKRSNMMDRILRQRLHARCVSTKAWHKAEKIILWSYLPMQLPMDQHCRKSTATGIPLHRVTDTWTPPGATYPGPSVSLCSLAPLLKKPLCLGRLQWSLFASLFPAYFGLFCLISSHMLLLNQPKSVDFSTSRTAPSARSQLITFFNGWTGGASASVRADLRWFPLSQARWSKHLMVLCRCLSSTSAIS